MTKYKGRSFGEVEQEAQAEVEQELELILETEVQAQVEVQKEIFVPIAQTGEAGSGYVVPLPLEVVEYLVATGEAADIQHPFGPQVGDKVSVITEMRPVTTIKKLSNATEYFDSTIFLSSVFERNLPKEENPDTPPQALFYRKLVKHVLISKSPTGAWSMIVPTIHESHGACRAYINSNPENVQAALVGISTGTPLMISKTGGGLTDALPFENLADQQSFYRLYVQAKLFNGETEFTTKEEQDALKAWLMEKGAVGFQLKYLCVARPSRSGPTFPGRDGLATHWN